MQLIGENIHIISKSVKEALLKRDEDFFSDLVLSQKHMDYIDLNVGPARGDFAGVLPWLTDIVQKNLPDIGISFDTTNYDEMKAGFERYNNPSKAFINSTSADGEKFELLSELALNYDCNIIALTMSKETGIPKTSGGRMELAFDMYEKFMEKGFDTEKVYFDPLVLPLTADQSQASEAINTIKMIKEGFEPQVKTVVGLSNISNGCPKNIRFLVNKVFAVLCCGAGLDAAIIDAGDNELIRVLKMLENKTPQSKIDELYIKLADMVNNFEEIESVSYDVNSNEESLIVKTAGIILNREVYSDSFTQI